MGKVISKIIKFFSQCILFSKKIDSGDHISALKSKELSDERIKAHAKSDNIPASSLNYFCTKTRVYIYTFFIK